MSMQICKTLYSVSCGIFQDVNNRKMSYHFKINFCHNSNRNVTFFKLLILYEILSKLIMTVMKSLFESASVSSVIGVGEVVRLSGSLDGRILKLLCQILGVQCSAPHCCSKMHQENCYLQDSQLSTSGWWDQFLSQFTSMKFNHHYGINHYL